MCHGYVTRTYWVTQFEHCLSSPRRRRLKGTTTDVARLELTKDGYGRYIMGDPNAASPVKFIWNLPIVESYSISAGTFMCGAFSAAADLIDRQSITVEVGLQHDQNFTSNLATLLCTERVGLAVVRPTAMVKGTFTTSPAS